MTARTAFDSDVLIYAASRSHPASAAITRLLDDDEHVGVGSVLLLPEVLSKPMRANDGSDESRRLIALISRLQLHPFDEPTARLALALAVSYRLRAADSVHLATAVAGGADRFLTNNRKDFPKSIGEIDIVYPEDIGAPS